jgi:hypothetical protein
MSDTPPQDPIEMVKHLGENYSQVTLGSGVVGKTSRVVWGLLPLWIIILWRLSESVLVDACLLGGGAICTGFVVWWVSRTHKFAEKNPSISLLEGAQLIEYQKFEAQAKGLPALTGVQIQLQQDPNLQVIPLLDPQSKDQ